jgi:hypothetical protein
MDAMVRFVAVFLALFGSSFAIAHDHWVSQKRLVDPLSGQWCCNHIDCREEKVSEVAGGYRVETGEVIPYTRVIWASPEGTWVRCRNMQTNATRCLIGPPPSL